MKIWMKNKEVARTNANVFPPEKSLPGCTGKAQCRFELSAVRRNTLEGLNTWQNHSFSVACFYDCPAAPVRKINKGLANSFLSSTLNISLKKNFEKTGRILASHPVSLKQSPPSLAKSRGKGVPEMNKGQG